MYDLQFRLKKKDMELLTKKEKEEYISTIKDMLQYIDDKIILDQKHYYQEHKVFALALKYDKTLDQIREDLTIKDGKIYYKDIEPEITSRIKLDIYDFKLKRKKLFIEGVLKTTLPLDKLRIFVISAKEESPIKIMRSETPDVKAIERIILKAYKFNLKTCISKEDKIKFKASFNNENVNTCYYLKNGLDKRTLVIKSFKKQ
jgi:hypothetical protein